MPKISFAGLKDPGKRARYLIWLVAIAVGGIAFTIVALGATSTYWFCAEGCHKVQDDTILAYDQSVHSNVHCMSCHMPPNADPVTFMLHKVEALGELYMTVTNEYELPLNGESHVALTMSAEQCTQCHNLANREVTPAPGLQIDHEKHIEEGVACTVCHNRVAHPEDFELTLNDPNTGEPNQPHDDFMTMNGCFRCHGLEEDAEAPGECIKCHPEGFDLVPDFHKEDDFFPAKHGELAMEQVEQVAEAEAEGAHGEAVEGHGEEGSHEESGTDAETEPADDHSRGSWGAEAAMASGGGEAADVMSYDAVNECYTCHEQQFCVDCHGVEMPHPAAFVEPVSADAADGHPAAATGKQAEKCVACHGDNDKTHFCDECHHGTQVEFEFNTKASWEKQHPDAVEQSGLDSCLEKCHEQKFCSDCHTSKKVVPSSHTQRYWTNPKNPTVTVYGKSPAKPSAKHALDAQKSIESCEICHGNGGPNAKFCKNCHDATMPHPSEFKKFHSKTGRQNPQICEDCHTWPELCSNCHHIGSSFTRPWIKVHGGSATKNGPDGCLEACHQKKDCIACHNAENAVPASHKSAKFTKDSSSKKAGHVQSYEKDAAICTYCHGDGGPDAKFCKSCHKVEMPHPVDEGDDQKYLHKENFKNKKVTKATCANCHTTAFCDSCHHEGSVANRPWLRYHPSVVKKGGADQCFDCHEEVYCSNCHVNLAKRGLLN